MLTHGLVLAAPPVLADGACPLPYPLSLVCSPTAPGTPFATPELVVFDGLRVLAIIAAVVVIAQSEWFAYRHTDTGGQAARLHSLALLAVSVLGTELSRLGDYASWRLLVNLAAVVLAIYGTLQLGREQPAQAKAPGRHR